MTDIKTIYKTEIEITTSDLTRFRALLSIEDMSQEDPAYLARLNADEDDEIEVYTAKFEDGSQIEFKLYSDDARYEDSIIWTKELDDGTTEFDDLLAQGKLDDLTIEPAGYGAGIYKVTIKEIPG